MMSRSDIWQSFAVTFISTLIGVALSLLLNAITAYPLAKKEFKPAKVIMILFVITMVFKAPMIPYFLTVKGVGLYNNPAVLVIPQLLNAFNMIIMVSFFRQFPAELEEAARMEGCGYFRLLFQMVLPLSKAVLATVGLFYAVVLWNQFQHPLMFLNKPEWFPLQIKIRQLIAAEDQLPRIGDNVTANFNATTLQSVVIIFAVVPILMVYPYLQKYFVKGAMLGSVKG
jgi:putative aldouronate transport system permease protein